MSLRTIEIILDRPRHLLFTLSALRDCCRRLGGISFLVMLQRLEQLDFEVLIQALHCGLRHEDKRLDLAHVEQMAQGYIDREGAITGLLQSVSEAIGLSGMIRRRAADGDGADPGEALGRSTTP